MPTKLAPCSTVVFTINKSLHISGSMQFNPVLFKVQLYSPLALVQTFSAPRKVTKMFWSLKKNVGLYAEVL